MNDSLSRSLADVVGSEAVLPAEENTRWAASAKTPRAVVFPSTTESVAEVLDLASREGWKVVPAGNGSWLHGGNPVDADLVLSVRRMRTVVEYEPAGLTLTAEAGIPMAAVEERTAAHGQWLPLDPPGVLGGSLGGLVATGVAGPLRQSYGTPRDHVLGLTLVTGDGRVLRLGGRVVKNVAGFDLTRLSIGSWGTLGVVTTLSARLFPLPEEDVTLVYRAPGLLELQEEAVVLARAPLGFGALELLDGVGVVGPDSKSGDAPGRGSPAGASLVVRLLASSPEAAEMERRLGELVQGLPVERLAGAASRGVHAAISRVEERAALVLRIAVLPSRLGVGLDLVKEFSAEAGLNSGEMRTAVHLGAGIIRIVVRSPSDGVHEEDRKAWERGLVSLREAAEGEGGSLTISKGPPELVREVGAWGQLGALARIHAELKREFDPAGVLSPGRFVV